MPHTVYAALADKAGNNPPSGHNQALRDWQTHTATSLHLVSTDTFLQLTSSFADFTPEQMISWKGLRHDSGDPIDYIS